MSLFDRLRHSWNAFLNADKNNLNLPLQQPISYYYNPTQIHLSGGKDRSIISSVYNRLAVDCAQLAFRHVILDGNNRFIKEKDSLLNNCLSVEPNKDQAPRQFFIDLIISLFDEGCVAVVPVDTTTDPIKSAFDIESMRVGQILQWYPDLVQVRVYNDNTGQKKELILPKRDVAIIENPFYQIMNEPNSTSKRLMKKLALLDITDENSASNRLDMVIQLPYSTRNELKMQHAEKRRDDIEKQLAESPYGIAYIDTTEKIVQLNRSVDNQLLTQIESLSRTLYSQLGLTEEIMNGTADENTMNNYYNRTIEPIASAIVEEFVRKFLTKTARSQKQTIMFFRDPFKLVSTSGFAELTDKLTRNEIMTSNEIRQKIGLKPSEDPKANELRNANIAAAKDETRRDVDGNIIDVGVKSKEEKENV